MREIKKNKSQNNSTKKKKNKWKTNRYLCEATKTRSNILKFYLLTSCSAILTACKTDSTCYTRVPRRDSSISYPTLELWRWTYKRTHYSTYIRWWLTWHKGNNLVMVILSRMAILWVNYLPNCYNTFLSIWKYEENG